MTIQRFAALQGDALTYCSTLPVRAALLAGLGHVQGMVAIHIRVS
ncbi:MAG: hypothetical protein NTV37_03715 [Proteobacteria bacterium]|nr:hypothetical protein [Pseudomonadota bacterium]